MRSVGSRSKKAEHTSGFVVATTSGNSILNLLSYKHGNDMELWLCAPVAIPEEIVGIVLVKIIPKRPDVQPLRFGLARKRTNSWRVLR